VKRYVAFEEICAELRGQDVLAVDEAAHDSIAAFAVG